MTSEDEAEIAAAIDEARRAGVDEAEIERVVRFEMARGGGDDPLIPIILPALLHNMARERETGADRERP